MRRCGGRKLQQDVGGSMSLDLALDPYLDVEWAEGLEDAACPVRADVKALPADELACLCEQAFQELDVETPAPGTLERYQELADEIEHRKLDRRQ